MHDFDSLMRDLLRGGIRPEDTLLVHSSLKKIGEVKGGLDTVLDVFLARPEGSGLAVFPTLSYNLNTENPVFSVRDTASIVGAIPENFRKRPGVLRSLHPTHSVAAFGRDAAEFVRGHEAFDSPCARLSPWGKLYDREGKILLLGVTLNSNTFFHGVEEWAGGTQGLTAEPQPLEVINYDGKRIPVPSRRHIGNHHTFYHLAEPFLEEAGAISRLTFGDAACTLLDCRKAADRILKLLREQPLFFTAEYQSR